MVSNNSGGGRALRIAMGIAVLVLLIAGGVLNDYLVLVKHTGASKIFLVI